MTTAAKEMICEAIGFEFAEGELQTLTGDELLTVFDLGQQHACISYNAVLSFVLDYKTECAEAFLRCWNEGDFDACRKEWPEAPAECYIGADTQLED